MKKLYNDAPFMNRKKGTSNEELASQLAQNTSKTDIVLGTGVMGEMYPRLFNETDDTARLQRAITDATTSKKGLIRFSTPVVEISSTINLTSGVKFEGLGWERKTNGIGTVFKRTADVVAFKGQGVSVVSGGGHIQNLEFKGIRFEGGNFASDYMQLIACSLAMFDNCQFFGMTGRQLLLHEVMDSRFNNCSFEWGGSVDGTLAAITLKSENGYEYTNEVHFVGCRWESYRGTAIDTIGGNNNEIFFTDCKFESTMSNQIHVKLYNSAAIYLDGVQIYSNGTAGSTIAAQIQMSGTRGVFGTVFLEHNPTGASLTRFINLLDTTSVDLLVFVYGGDTAMVNNYVVESDANSHAVNIRGFIRGTNPNKKQLYRYQDSFQLEGLSVRSYGVPLSRMQNLNYDDVWDTQVIPDGTSTKIEYSRIKQGTTTTLWRIDDTNNIKMLRNLWATSGFYLAPLATTSAPFATNGAMYYDTTTNTIKAYVNGAWKTVNVT